MPDSRATASRPPRRCARPRSRCRTIRIGERLTIGRGSFCMATGAEPLHITRGFGVYVDDRILRSDTLQKGDLMDQVSRSFETQQPAFPFWGTSGCPVSAMPDDPPVEVPPVKSGGYPLEAPPLPEPEKPP